MHAVLLPSLTKQEGLAALIGATPVFPSHEAAHRGVPAVHNVDSDVPNQQQRRPVQRRERAQSVCG